mgnify:FL=1
MAKEEEKKEEKKKMKIEPLSDTVDLNAINFRNKDVKKWTERKKSINKPTETSTLAGMGALGGPSGSRFRRTKKKK